jgi:hypothetical protein
MRCNRNITTERRPVPRNDKRGIEKQHGAPYPDSKLASAMDTLTWLMVVSFLVRSWFVLHQRSLILQINHSCFHFICFGNRAARLRKLSPIEYAEVRVPYWAIATSLTIKRMNQEGPRLTGDCSLLPPFVFREPDSLSTLATAVHAERGATGSAATAAVKLRALPRRENWNWILDKVLRHRFRLQTFAL